MPRKYMNTIIEKDFAEAIYHNDFDAVEYILKVCDINLNLMIDRKLRMTPLRMACCLPVSSELFSILLKYGADPYRVFEYERSTLHVTCNDGYHEKLIILLQHNVNVNDQRRHGGATLLMESCMEEMNDDRLFCMELLLEHGADVNIPHSNGITAVFFAIRSPPSDDKLEGIRLLLENGADVNYQTPTDRCSVYGCVKGDTILHLVARRNDVDVFQLILECGDPHVWIRNSANETPLDIARNLGSQSIIECIRMKLRQICQSYLMENWLTLEGIKPISQQSLQELHFEIKNKEICVNDQFEFQNTDSSSKQQNYFDRIGLEANHENSRSYVLHKGVTTDYQLFYGLEKENEELKITVNTLKGKLQKVVGYLYEMANENESTAKDLIKRKAETFFSSTSFTDDHDSNKRLKLQHNNKNFSDNNSNKRFDDCNIGDTNEDGGIF